jgi:hypothetical protein
VTGDENRTAVARFRTAPQTMCIAIETSSSAAATRSEPASGWIVAASAPPPAAAAMAYPASAVAAPPAAATPLPNEVRAVWFTSRTATAPTGTASPYPAHRPARIESTMRRVCGERPFGSIEMFRTVSCGDDT